MLRTTAEQTLAQALSLGPRELVSLVGAGGKTTALRLLAGELTAAGGTVLATTTTALRLRELEGLGRMVMAEEDEELEARLTQALARGRTAAAARGPLPGGKVRGLTPDAVDELWRRRLADRVLVEADGSAGRPLKAFAAHEPQLPADTSVVAQLAGLSALGRPLRGESIHRAALLAAALGVAAGSEVTPAVFAAALRLQLRRLRELAPRARIVTVLNQSDACAAADALEVARLLLEPGEADAGDARRAGEPGVTDAVVLACLREGRLDRVLNGAA